MADLQHLAPGFGRFSVLGVFLCRVAPCLGLSLLGLAGCAEEAAVPPAQPAEVRLGFEVIEELPHDEQAFTQGLLFHEGQLYEATGGYGTSSLRLVDRQTGAVRKQVKLNDRYFGEGIACVGENIYQLTWKAGLVIVYDRNTLEYLKTHRYRGEGWGLTYDGTHLILSDGSPRLRFYEPQTFELVKSIEVRAEDGPVGQLNELEYVDGAVFANVWRSDEIVKIDPESGKVLGRLDLSSLQQPRPTNREAVLNGIAYDGREGHLLVTGKLWPKQYFIRLRD